MEKRFQLNLVYSYHMLTHQHDNRFSKKELPVLPLPGYDLNEAKIN